MLELPPAAAEELARKRAEQMADLPFVFEIYAQIVSTQSERLLIDPKNREKWLKGYFDLASEAVSVLKEEYK